MNTKESLYKAIIHLEDLNSFYSGLISNPCIYEDVKALYKELYHYNSENIQKLRKKLKQYEY